MLGNAVKGKGEESPWNTLLDQALLGSSAALSSYKTPLQIAAVITYEIQVTEYGMVRTDGREYGSSYLLTVFIPLQESRILLQHLDQSMSKICGNAESLPKQL